jgi:hypothetical protein
MKLRSTTTSVSIERTALFGTIVETGRGEEGSDLCATKSSVFALHAPGGEGLACALTGGLIALAATAITAGCMVKPVNPG